MYRGGLRYYCEATATGSFRVGIFAFFFVNFLLAAHLTGIYNRDFPKKKQIAPF